MAKENTQSVETDESASVSDADLDAAAGATEETQEVSEETSTETVVEETKLSETDVLAKQLADVDKLTRSLDGRFRHMSGDLTAIRSAIDGLASKPEQEEVVGYPATPEELDQRIERKIAKSDAAKTKQNKDYSDNYNKTFAGLAADDSEEDFNGIYEVMLKDFNVRSSDDGVRDASLNFGKACKAYFQKKNAGPLGKTINVKGEKPPDTVTTQQAQTRTVPTVKLDPAAADFVKHTGWDDKKVQEVLSTPTPTYLGGKG